MFTGIIEHLGVIRSLDACADGGRVTVVAPTLASSLAISSSIAVNGCCLTIVAIDKETFSADLSGETLARTSFRTLKAGDRVNIEQPLTAGKEFGGHFVLGHVDTIGQVLRLNPQGENWWFEVEVPEDFARYIVPKGSIAIDGISLTVARSDGRIAEVAVIPYTYGRTTIRDRQPGDAVNLEGDVLGKYVERYLESRKSHSATGDITIDKLIGQGF